MLRGESAQKRLINNGVTRVISKRPSELHHCGVEALIDAARKAYATRIRHASARLKQPPTATGKAALPRAELPL